MAAYTSSPTTRDTMWLRKLPAAHRSLLPDAMGMMPLAFSVSQAASSSSQVVGGVMPASARICLSYHRTLVTSAVYGSITTLPSMVADGKTASSKSPASGPERTASVRSAA